MTNEWDDEFVLLMAWWLGEEYDLINDIKETEAWMKQSGKLG